jgi:hypothetical protein
VAIPKREGALAARRHIAGSRAAKENQTLEAQAPSELRSPNASCDLRDTALKAALLFLCVNTWQVRFLLSLKRATQFLDLTRPCAARHLGFRWYRRAFRVDCGKLGGRGRGYDSFRIHDKCPAKVEGARLSQCVSF